MHCVITFDYNYGQRISAPTCWRLTGSTASAQPSALNWARWRTKCWTLLLNELAGEQPDLVALFRCITLIMADADGIPNTCSVSHIAV